MLAPHLPRAELALGCPQLFVVVTLLQKKEKNFCQINLLQLLLALLWKSSQSSFQSRLPWLGLERSLLRLGGAVMDGRWAQQITGRERSISTLRMCLAGPGSMWLRGREGVGMGNVFSCPPLNPFSAPHSP